MDRAGRSNPGVTTGGPGLDADVLVVGCGPVGVMTALRCAQRGLRVIAVERTSEVYPLPRAIGMDAEIQRLFDAAGLIDELRSCSSPMPGAEFVDATGRRVVGFDLEPGTLSPLGYPPMVAFDQPSLERFLRAAAAAAGVELRYGLEAVGLDVGSDGHPAVVFAADGGERSLAARWVVGADGASSTIRKLLGVFLLDQGFDQTWLVLDTTLLDPDLELPSIIQQICDPQRITTFVIGHGTRRRWEFQLHPGESRGAAVDEAFVSELLSSWGTPDQLAVDRAAVYRFHATVAERFGAGDVFLAGDAAHQMPPFNGQGMCSGMRDADNLAWKLAMVAGGHAGDVLLETYDHERRPHAAGQVAHSADAGRLIDAIAAGRAEQLDAGYGGGRPFPHLESGVLDGDHPWLGRPIPAPREHSAPIHDLLGAGWSVVATGPLRSDLTARWEAIGGRTVLVDRTTFPGLVEPGVAAIVRPDHYVAAVTSDLYPTTDRLFARLGR